jgi:hypothetical protein
MVDMANIAFFLVNGEQELDILCRPGSDTIYKAGTIAQVTGQCRNCHPFHAKTPSHIYTRLQCPWSR